MIDSYNLTCKNIYIKTDIAIFFLDQVGGPSWIVKLGRRDSTTASKNLANSDLPLFTDDLETLISRFSKKGLSARDMVTLFDN